MTPQAATETSSSAPSCHLYTLAPSQRVRNELKERGIEIDGTSHDETFDIALLNEIDGMRYQDDYGTNVFKTHLDIHFGTGSSLSVLDVGSGFGGPSRLLALTRPNTKLVALEIVPEISDIAQLLTERTQVADTVAHRTGDICTVDSSFLLLSPQQQGFHAAQAVLSLLHVPDIDTALSTVCRHLEPNGIMYIEDFYVEESNISDEMLKDLKDIVGCPRGVPMTQSEWIACLQDAGFRGEIQFENVTNAWQPWVHERRIMYENDMERHVRVHGTDAANHMLEFYKTMDTLFSTNLRGCRILAKKL